MYRLTLVFLVLFMMCGKLCSQSLLGLRFGGNLSELKVQGSCTNFCSVIDEYRSLLPGFQLGITADHQLGNKISLGTAIIYSRRGFSKPDFREVYTNMNYLSFPFTLNIQFLDGPLDFLFGLEPGILLSARKYVDGASSNIKKEWSNFDVGTNWGIAYRLNRHLRLKLSYYLGITPLYSSPVLGNNGGNVNSAALRMRSFQCSIFYYL